MRVIGYSVSDILPFRVMPMYADTPVGVGIDKYFDRRGDAEKASLEDLYYYYKVRDMKEEQTNYYQQLKNFDEEHPEWMI